MRISPKLAALWPLALAAACGPAARNQAPAAPQNNSGPASALERAAIRAGVVSDPRTLSPVGLYRNRHEAGLDSLCIVPDPQGQMRFGLEAAFGEGIECRGQGTLRRTGDKLVLNFARSACLAVVSYEGDRIAFPGAMDVECRSLCKERGSLEGVSVPRVSREEAVARAAKTSGGEPLCSQ